MSATHLDLCSGIGGFALAAQWAGYTTIGFCEIDPWCRRVLAKNFPKVPQHDDLKTLTGGIVREWISGAAGQLELPDAHSDGRQSSRVDSIGHERSGWGTARDQFGPTHSRRLGLITGGYPCQPFSLAGKRLGAADDRHLWPAIAALVADLKPQRCLFENVYGHVSMGLDAVLADLEALGYACGAVVVPACAVGAPHRRDRAWILADSSGIRGAATTEREQHAQSNRGRQANLTISADAVARTGILADADQQRINGTGARRAGRDESPNGRSDAADAPARGIRRGRASGHDGQPARGGEGDHDGQALSGVGQPPDGLPRFVVGPGVIDPWAGDWEAGCPRTQEHEPDRVHKLKALGNAIVPQVAYAILDAWGAIEPEEVMPTVTPPPDLPSIVPPVSVSDEVTFPYLSQEKADRIGPETLSALGEAVKRALDANEHSSAPLPEAMTDEQVDAAGEAIWASILGRYSTTPWNLQSRVVQSRYRAAAHAALAAAQTAREGSK